MRLILAVVFSILIAALAICMVFARRSKKAIGKYVALAGVLYAISSFLPIENVWMQLSVRTCLMIVFIGYIVKNDFPLKRIPFINRFIKK